MKCGNKKSKHSICKVTQDDLISIVLCIGVEWSCFYIHMYRNKICLRLDECAKYLSDILVTIMSHLM